MSCGHCKQTIFTTEEDIKQVAENFERHAVLLQCERCGAYWEAVAEEKGPKEVSFEFVKLHYPTVKAG